MDPKLSIVIPTYNEEGNIEKMLTLTNEILKKSGVSHELIVVDDQSKDATRAVVKELQKKISEIKLIERDSERGLATALIAGYTAARGEWLGSMDADLASDPQHLPEMITALKENDFVIGSRYLPGSKFQGKPFLNQLASILGQFLVRWLLKIKVRDTSNNYRLFKKEVWEAIKNLLHPNGNIMITEIAYLAEKAGFRMKEIPIIYIERRHGKSKLSIWQEAMNFFRNIQKIKNGR